MIFGPQFIHISPSSGYTGPTPDGTASTLPYSITTQSSSYGPSAQVRFYIDMASSSGNNVYFANNSNTPLEAKRLWAAAAYNTSVSYQPVSAIYFKDTNGNDVSSPDVGDFAYGWNNDPSDPRPYHVARSFDMGANQNYYWFAARYDGTSVYSPSLQPTDTCYWIKMDTTTSEIVALYDNGAITKNILTNVNQKATATNTSVNGEVFFSVNPGGFSNPNGHSSYSNALNQDPADARPWGEKYFGLYSVSGTGLPAVGDRIYDQASNSSYGLSSSNFHEYAIKTLSFVTNGYWIAYNRDWDSTTTQYAIKVEVVGGGGSYSFKEITEIRDSSGNSITSVPNVTPAPSQTVTPASSGALFGFQTDSDLKFQSNEHTTPAESKRLWNLGNNTITGLYQFYPDTANLAAGTKLYVDYANTSLAYDVNQYPNDTRNSYAYYIINSNASNQWNQNPASVDYWVKVDTSNSTIVYIYTDASVTANTLKDVTSNVGSGGTVGTNGAFFFGDGNTGYSTYQGALGANISNQDYGYQLYVDSEDKYPKIGDRTYVTTTNKDSGIWGGSAGYWFPFLLEGTTSSGSVQYAVQVNYASYNGSNIATTSPGSSNNLFITDIKDTNGNSVTQIT